MGKSELRFSFLLKNQSTPIQHIPPYLRSDFLQMVVMYKGSHLSISMTPVLAVVLWRSKAISVLPWPNSRIILTTTPAS